jgi:hypothetical protein
LQLAAAGKMGLGSMTAEEYDLMSDLIRSNDSYRPKVVVSAGAVNNFEKVGAKGVGGVCSTA